MSLKEMNSEFCFRDEKKLARKKKKERKSVMLSSWSWSVYKMIGDCDYHLL